MNPKRIDPVKRLRFAFGLILLLLFGGTIGFIAIEDYTILEAMYMTVITLSSVGFHEVKTLSTNGRIFTMILILSGVGTVAYSLSMMTESLRESNIIKQRRRDGRIAKMNDHIIICGYGRIGQRVARRLSQLKVAFVIIEVEGEAETHLEETGFPFVRGDARDDATLQRAGILHARSLVAALKDDSDNVYVILSARALNAKLHIVARAISPGSESKLIQAGANRVISPYDIGSHYVLNAVLRPSVLDFMDFVSEVQTDKKQDLEIDEIFIPENSPLANMPLLGTHIRSKRNIIVLAVKEEGGSVMYNPPSSRVIQAGETLICIGYVDQLDLLSKEIQGKSAM